MTIREDNYISYSSPEAFSYYYKKKTKLFKRLCEKANLDMRIVNGEIELSDCISDDEEKNYFFTEMSANKIWNSIDEMQFTPNTSFQQAVFDRYTNWLKKKNKEKYLRTLEREKNSQKNGQNSGKGVWLDDDGTRIDPDFESEEIDRSSLNLDKDEAAARGAQIKSMLGIKDNIPISSKQLRYIKDNSARITGMDSNMQSFLNSISDFDKSAKWLSKYSYSTGSALNLLGVTKNPSGKRGL